MPNLNKTSTALIFLLGSIAARATAEEPIDVVNKWMKSCSQLDIDGMASNYFEDASSFLTVHRELVIGKAGVSDYLKSATSGMDPASMNCRFTPYTNMRNSVQQATIAGWDRITGKIDEKDFINEGRISFILNKRDGIWKISHFHRSPLPAKKNDSLER